MLLAATIGLLIALEVRSPGGEPFDIVDTGSDSSTPRASTNGQQPRLTKPSDLLLLEGPDRDSWQKPEQIMDELRIAERSRVADIGAGSGWFTVRLAQRVGDFGRVYATDVQPEMLTAITRRVSRERSSCRAESDTDCNVETVRSSRNATNLPLGTLDAILVVDVYPELDERVTFLRNLTKSLKPRGRIGVVNYKPGAGGPGPPPERRFPPSVVEQDARDANLRVLSTMDLRYQYVIVLGRGGSSDPPSSSGTSPQKRGP
jgi:SAM-dependent methyltransferase